MQLDSDDAKVAGNSSIPDQSGVSDETVGNANESQSAAESQEAGGGTPNNPPAVSAEAQAGGKAEPFHKNPRFQELIKEKNELKQRIALLEQAAYQKVQEKGMDPKEQEVQNFLQPYIEKMTQPYKQALGVLYDEIDRLNLVNDKQMSLTPEMMDEVEQLRRQYAQNGLMLSRKDIAIYLAGKKALERESLLQKQSNESKRSLENINKSGQTETMGTHTSVPQKDINNMSTNELEKMLKDTKF